MDLWKTGGQIRNATYPDCIHSGNAVDSKFPKKGSERSRLLFLCEEIGGFSPEMRLMKSTTSGVNPLKCLIPNATRMDEHTGSALGFRAVIDRGGGTNTQTGNVLLKEPAQRWKVCAHWGVKSQILMLLSSLTDWLTASEVSFTRSLGNGGCRY